MIEIRPCRPEERDLLPDIENDAFKAMSAIGITPAFGLREQGYYSREVPNAYAVVAMDQDVAVGFAVMIESDGQACLYELSVKLDYQKRGIGARLIEATVDFAKSNGYRAITLTTCRDVPFNRPFYEKMEFRVFEPDQSWPRLAALLKKERRVWRGVQERVAMIRMFV